MGESPTIRLTIDATSADEFARKAAERLRGEFFVPWDLPLTGARVRFEAPFGGGASGVRGEAMARPAIERGRKGVMLRAIKLDPESIQVPLPGQAGPALPPLTPIASGDASRRDGAPTTPPARASTPSPIRRVPTPLPLPATRPATSDPVASVTPPPARATTPLPTTGKPPSRPGAPPASPARNVVRRQTTASEVRVERATPAADFELEADSDLEWQESTKNSHVSAEMAQRLREPAPAPANPAPAVMPSPPRAEQPPVARPKAEQAPAALPKVQHAPAVPQRTLASLRANDMVSPRRRRVPSRAILALCGAAAVAAAVIIFVVARSGSQPDDAPKAAPRPDEVARHLEVAAERVQQGRLTGPGGDEALDHLLAARKAAPDDARVKKQLSALADAFEKLGDGALAAGDVAEAAAHYQAAINAEPDRASATTKLHDAEQRTRDQQHAP